MRLDKVNGPECPACGCEDGEVLELSTWFGQPRERRRCNHCGRIWLANVEPPAEIPQPEDVDRPVVYQLTACPHCGSTRTHVTSTRRPIRHHKCLACGWTFKSCEKHNGELGGARKPAD
ncbi:MAG: hypothetical protein ABIK89_23325 [Planctomycetota bacterium]